MMALVARDDEREGADADRLFTGRTTPHPCFGRQIPEERHAGLAGRHPFLHQLAEPEIATLCEGNVGILVESGSGVTSPRAMRRAR